MGPHFEGPKLSSRLRHSPRAQRVERGLVRWVFEPYSDPAIWLNACANAVTILCLIGGENPRQVSMLLIFAPFVVYPIIHVFRKRRHLQRGRVVRIRRST